MEILLVLLPVCIIISLPLAVGAMMQCGSLRRKITELEKKLDGEIRTAQCRIDTLEIRLRDRKNPNDTAGVIAPEKPPETNAPPPILIPKIVTPLFAEAIIPEPELPPENFQYAPALPPLPAEFFEEKISPKNPPAKFEWERFFGTKLIAWLGGLALFLGLVYLSIESFQRGWIAPWVRVSSGAIFGFSLIGVGLKFRDTLHRVTMQTLVGTGIVTLFAMVYVCRGFYEFPFFTPPVTFFLFVILTLGAFCMAGLLRAQIVAILGLLAGFLTPLLIGTDSDSPLILFGYLATLTTGILWTGGKFRWQYLSPLAGLGFAILFAIWYFPTIQNRDGIYDETRLALIPLAVSLVFPALHLGFSALFKNEPERDHAAKTTFILALVPLAVSAHFLHQNFPFIQTVPTLVCLFSSGLLAIGAIYFLKQSTTALFAFSIVTTLSLGNWLGHASPDCPLLMIMVVLVTNVVIYGILPVTLQHFRKLNFPSFTAPAAAFLGFGLVVFILATRQNSQFETGILILSFAIIAAIIGVILRHTLAIHMALLAGTLCFFIAIARLGIPKNDFESCVLLAFICAFVLGFVALIRWFLPRIPDNDTAQKNLKPAINYGAFLMPFFLFASAVGVIPMKNPAVPFVALTVVGILLTLTMNWLKLPKLCAIGIAGTVIVEWIWQLKNPLSDGFFWFAFLAIAWTAVPFLTWKKWISNRQIWAFAASSVPLHYLILRENPAAFIPESLPGILPLLCAIPAGAGFYFLWKNSDTENPARLTSLAWFGGALLGFITLIFPTQFECEWLTVSLALEAMALCWLTHFVPHRGLSGTAVALLAATLFRLTFGIEFSFENYARDIPMLNIYSYVYGAAIACFLGAARFLKNRKTELKWHPKMPAILCGGAIGLLFVLMNIEIADCFAATGSRLRFSFVTNNGSGLAQAMTYTLAWGIFALILMVGGILKKMAPARYAGLILLGVTLLKLFFFDLVNLQNIYRIAVLIGTAVIALGASLVYQKYFRDAKK